MNLQNSEKLDGGLIVEASAETFNEAVINASAQVPVIVDF